jgi:hypothetical protein
MNPNEFERTKPTITMKKINDPIKLIDEERVKTEILYIEIELEVLRTSAY